jgi:hypothetical protein
MSLQSRLATLITTIKGEFTTLTGRVTATEGVANSALQPDGDGSGLTGIGGINGIAELDFGSSAKTATVVVTGVTGIESTSVVFLAMRIAATVDHTIDDLLVDPIRLQAMSIVAGTGFTIYGEMDNAPANGIYNVQWTAI